MYGAYLPLPLRFFIYMIFYRSMRYLTNLVLTVIVMLLAFSCVNKIEVINAITQESDQPVLAVSNSEMMLSDSGKVKVRLTAVEVNRYLNGNNPYFIFPKGMKVEFFDKDLQVESVITANYSRYDEQKKLWEAKGNVICRSLKKHEELRSEEMFWSQNDGRIYSTKFTRVINADGNFTGEGGFESDQALTSWKLIGSKGTVNMKE